jgi:putative spermidine/putrescine transport system ATP-binding protein
VNPLTTAKDTTRPTRSPAPTPGAALSIEGVSKRYGDHVAVRGVSLAIPAGEFLTLLGPSGSGKTTTLNMIAGFVQPDAGELSIDGASITRLPPHKRNIGMVFQNYALFPHMTVYENVAFPLKQRRVSKPEVRRQVGDALELARMITFAGRYPRQLSGGQQQRVALARALVFRPGVLLMDEPLGALDKKLREALQIEIKRIHRELGSTFVYVTHDQQEALAMSDRIAIFNDGRIVQVADPTGLYERPTSEFVADFIGESNLFRGRLLQRDANLCLQSGALCLRVEPQDGWSAGQDASVIVRPERLRLVPPDHSATDGWNVADGHTAEVTYLGDVVKHVVELTGADTRVVVQTQADGRRGLRAIGDPVRVTWPSGAGVLVRSEATASPDDPA